MLMSLQERLTWSFSAAFVKPVLYHLLPQERERKGKEKAGEACGPSLTGRVDESTTSRAKGSNGPHPSMKDKQILGSPVPCKCPTTHTNPGSHPHLSHTSVARLAVPLLRDLRGTRRKKENLPPSSKCSVSRSGLVAAAPRQEDCPRLLF